MTKKDRFLQLVANQETDTLDSARERKQNRMFVRRSQEIALAILDRLDALEWSQRKLAEEMGVTPQQVNKWVKGSENFTLDTIVNLETVLKTSLISIQLQQQKLSNSTKVTASADYQKKSPGSTKVFPITKCISERRTYQNK